MPEWQCIIDDLANLDRKKVAPSPNRRSRRIFSSRAGRLKAGVELIPDGLDLDPYNVVMAGLRAGHPFQTKSLKNNHLP
jgi:hypothetical protein